MVAAGGEGKLRRLEAGVGGDGVEVAPAFLGPDRAHARQVLAALQELDRIQRRLQALLALQARRLCQERLDAARFAADRRVGAERHAGALDGQLDAGGQHLAQAVEGLAQVGTRGGVGAPVEEGVEQVVA